MGGEKEYQILLYERKINNNNHYWFYVNSFLLIMGLDALKKMLYLNLKHRKMEQEQEKGIEKSCSISRNVTTTLLTL